MAVPVLGDVADALLAALAGGQRGDVLVEEADGAGVGVAQADERVDQLGLAVALDAGDAEDLTGVDGEGDVVEQGLAAGRGQAQRVDGEDRAVGDRGLRRLGVGSSLPTISSASWRGVVWRGRPCRPWCRGG